VEDNAAEMRASAEAEKKALLLEAKAEAIRILGSAEEDARQLRLEVGAQERRLRQKEENLDRKTEELETRQRRLQVREEEADVRVREVERLRVEQIAAIERVAALTRDEARNLLLQRVEEEVRTEAGRRARVIEMEARQQAETQARKILSVAIQRYSSDTVGEITTSVVPIPNEEMKGRIIGREGRNIRALEAVTGVDLIIDDTPDAVTLSCFDPVRREIARLALTKLVQDGRIHPARIEEIVAKSKQEIEQEIREEDGLRRQSLRRAAKFVEEVPAEASADFLARLKAHLTFANCAADHGRAFELVNKTNQFNLNGVRYSEAEWKTKNHQPGRFLTTVSYEDRFGPLGKIAVLGGWMKDDRCCVDIFVMSCRAFSRHIEFQALQQLFAKSGASAIRLQFRPTERNGPLQTFLRRFFPSDSLAEGELELSAETFAKSCPPLFHEVIFSESD